MDQILQHDYMLLKPFLNNKDAFPELKEMCSRCKDYQGIEHNYENCLAQQCFAFWLAYEHLVLTNMIGGSHGQKS